MREHALSGQADSITNELLEWVPNTTTNGFDEPVIPSQFANRGINPMIRISETRKDSKRCLLVEGTLSGDWVDVLETCWLEGQTPLNGKPMRIDLSGVTYVDDKGSQLLARMIRDGAELRATGVMTRAVIEEITARENSP